MAPQNLETSFPCAEGLYVENAHSAVHRVGQHVGSVGTQHHPRHGVRVPADLGDDGVLPQVPHLDHVVDARAHHLARVLVEADCRHLISGVQAGQRLSTAPVPNLHLEFKIINFARPSKGVRFESSTWQSSPPDTTRGLLPLEQSTLFTKLVWPFILLILSPVQVSHTPTCQEQIRNHTLLFQVQTVLSVLAV